MKDSKIMVLIPIKYIYHIIQKIIQKITFPIELWFSKKIHIISSEKSGEPILQFKAKSFERTFFSKIFNFAEDSWVDFLYSKIEVRKFKDARVYSGSDFIITKDGAVWEKYFKPQWAKIIPLDNVLLKIKNQYVWIKKVKHIQTIEYGFSLCGVHSTIWAHFLVQYLPKLYLLKEIQSVVNNDLIVIVPHYNDSQIREIVYTYLSQLKNIKITELEHNEAADCKVLYHIENTSHLSDHSNYLNPSDCCIPRFTIDLLIKNLINPLFENDRDIQDSALKPFRKLYIGRTGYRNMLNNAEVEKCFVGLGFEVIHPHLFNLNEKVKIFREAAIIVGPGSSGFTNILFCSPGAKVLVFMNFQRTFDGYLSTFAKHFGVDLMYITGYDQNDSVHSSYHIPLNKIKLAYKELIS